MVKELIKRLALCNFWCCRCIPHLLVFFPAECEFSGTAMTYYHAFVIILHHLVFTMYQ
uniref:Uncharacterized protein n=1 Tax=Arundo donax TaxID=35708 RepID=A0A0A9F947_ARUDO